MSLECLQINLRALQLDRRYDAERFVLSVTNGGSDMSDSYYRLLRKMPVFGGLTDDTLELILSQSEKCIVATGEYFFRQGESSGSLFVVEQGVVVAERLWKNTSIELGRFEPGDCFGEMSLIDLMPRSASTRAEGECQAMEIRLNSLRALLLQDIEQYAIIMMNMGREVSRRLRVADDRLFELQQKVPEPAV